DLDAYRGTDVTHAEALRMQCHKSLTFSNPYGLLALAVHAALTLSTNLMQTQRRAREWGDTHVSVMTKRTLTPMEVRMSHRKHVCRVLREAREEFCKNVAGLSPAGRDLVEAGRKRVRLDILTMLKEIDDGMFDSGAILEDGDFLYIMRSWIQTLTNE
ncbi:MAG: hypothetical protein KAI25_15095, partial [Hyphomicrobiaceae bacterium]|nr:hypothetical protein [Hyphomicrobiaceae bacterium]